MSKNNMSWWSALLSSSGGLFDSLANLFSGGQWNKVALRDQRKANEKFYNYTSALDWEYAQKSMRLAADINKEQYAYEYGLESPRARVLQFKEAGLNPGLMYSGAGGSGMQGSVGTVNAPPIKGSTPSMSYPQSTLSGMVDLMKVGSEIQKNLADARDADASAAEKRGDTEPARVAMELQRSQTDLNRQMIKNKISEEQQTKVNTAIDELSLEIGKATKQITIDTARAELNVLKQSYQKVALEIDSLRLGLEEKQLYISGIAIDVAVKLAEYQYFIENGHTVNTALVESTLASAKELGSRDKLNLSNSLLADAEAEGVKTRITATAIMNIAIGLASVWGVGKAGKAAWQMASRTKIGFK